LGQKPKKSRKSPTKVPKGDAYHHGDLRKSLVDAAIRMLKTVPPSELSLRALAREAGVSIAAPYRHFKDKDSLLAAIATEGYTLKFNFMADGIRKAKGDPEAMYFGCGLAYFRMGLRHPQHFKLMTSSEVRPNEVHPELMHAATKTFMLLQQMILVNQKAGLIGPGDLVHKAMNCWTLVHGFTALYTEGRLTWLGVDEGNAEAALKALMFQYRIGNREALDSKAAGFIPFTGIGADLKKKAALEQVNAEVLAVFDIFRQRS
jgi:AcrR family transcriptional regulator